MQFFQKTIDFLSVKYSIRRNFWKLMKILFIENLAYNQTMSYHQQKKFTSAGFFERCFKVSFFFRVARFNNKLSVSEHSSDIGYSFLQVFKNLFTQLFARASSPNKVVLHNASLLGLAFLFFTSTNVCFESYSK